MTKIENTEVREKLLKEQVDKIVKENFRLNKRFAALKEAGFDVQYINKKDFDEEKYFYFACACSRDWNKTYGYAIIKK